MHKLITPTEDRELVLDSYVLHVNTQICTSCGNCERYSTLFECWTHPKKHMTRLTRVDGQALKKLPLSHINQPQRSIPMCTACIGKFESTDRTPLPACTPEQWAETLRRKYAPEPQAPAQRASESKPIKAVPTLEDL
jgi:hypothetical protein